MSVGMLCVRHDASSAAVVRREIAADLSARSVTADSVDDVVLVVSELVGNAVVHSAPASDLDVAWDVEDHLVIVRVKDHSERAPHPRDASDDATSGRGLAIVAALSAEWGVQRATRGKQVWAKVPVHLAI
ncbi:ATP-binding protein [Jatrophihabitans endophyticus]|uniref:ATP-binding protein n=1 Tax=Jatrophihabitans endophyticus TaxID=1206085 RepID=UPI0019EA2489|nr:ATP-binding protein [Jatrophihabitans endophyticus]MBE7187332.1 ATP-binding protein [Jatrophihabitans endophyticus]